MKDIVISTAIILFIGLVGSFLFQTLTAPGVPVDGVAWHPTVSHDAAFWQPAVRHLRIMLLSV
jgi:hypothetical protein